MDLKAGLLKIISNPYKYFHSSSIEVLFILLKINEPIPERGSSISEFSIKSIFNCLLISLEKNILIVIKIKQDEITTHLDKPNMNPAIRFIIPIGATLTALVINFAK